MSEIYFEFQLFSCCFFLLRFLLSSTKVKDEKKIRGVGKEVNRKTNENLNDGWTQRTIFWGSNTANGVPVSCKWTPVECLLQERMNQFHVAKYLRQRRTTLDTICCQYKVQVHLKTRYIRASAELWGRYDQAPRPTQPTPTFCISEQRGLEEWGNGGPRTRSGHGDGPDLCFPTVTLPPRCLILKSERQAFY